MKVHTFEDDEKICVLRIKFETWDRWLGDCQFLLRHPRKAPATRELNAAERRAFIDNQLADIRYAMKTELGLPF